jgi:glutamate racemase
VIGTEGTVRGGAYQRAICRGGRRPRSGATVSAARDVAEEGWVTGDVPERVVEAYLGEWLREESHPDCLLLGCTHFPILAPVIQRVGGPALTLVDSAATTAAAVA